jgi:putative serine protease PepD
VFEPRGPESPRGRWAIGSGGITTRLLLACVLAAAVAGGAVAAGVAVAVLHAQSRTNPQTLNLGSQVTISEDTAAVNVARNARPAVASIFAGGAPPARGSGFLVTSDGYLVTNVDVIAGANGLGVLLNRGDRHDARVVGFDCQTGLAVLKVDQVSGLPTLAFGDSTSLQPGDTVVAVGGDLSERLVVSRGVISSLHRQVTVPDPAGGQGQTQLTDLVQTDAAVEPSSAGGPLMNVGGQVIGVTMAVPGQPYGVALAASDIQPEVQQIVQTGQLLVPTLGAQALAVNAQDAALKGTTAGARLTSVTPGGPADRAGLKVGDVITQVGDAAVDDAHPLDKLLRDRFQPDQKVTVTYERAGAGGQVQLTLGGERPACP